jgi:hypothetical protein
MRGYTVACEMQNSIVDTGNKERSVIAMGTTIGLKSITLNQQETSGLTWEEEKKIVNILIDSSLYLEMSLADRKRLIQYILTMYSEPLK